MKIRSKAPLRIGLGGGGTDLSPYCDEYTGYILNATISMHAYCTIEVLDSDKIIFETLDSGEFLEVDSALFYPIDKQLILQKGVYNRIIKDYVKRPLSFKMSTYSEAPIGSGLGGSSTLVVAIIKAFVEWLNIPLGEYEIAKLAFEIEREDIGVVGGAQDQYAATFGGFNFMEFYDNKRVIVNPLRIKNWILDEFESSFVLYFTGITRSASVIEEEKSNTTRKVKDALNAMHQVKKDAISMKEMLLKGDILQFAEILGKSWHTKKKMATSVSNKEIDDIYNLAVSNGALAGKVSGAGGGGFMFFIVKPENKYQLVKKLNEQSGNVVSIQFTKDGTRGWRI